MSKYQPSGAGGTCSLPATLHRLQHLTACLIQNGWQGLVNHFFYENLKNPKWPPGGAEMAIVVCAQTIFRKQRSSCFLSKVVFTLRKRLFATYPLITHIPSQWQICHWSLNLSFPLRSQESNLVLCVPRFSFDGPPKSEMSHFYIINQLNQFYLS